LIAFKNSTVGSNLHNCLREVTKVHLIITAYRVNNEKQQKSVSQKYVKEAIAIS